MGNHEAAGVSSERRRSSCSSSLYNLFSGVDILSLVSASVMICVYSSFNTLRPRQNGHDFADYISNSFYLM